MGYYADWKLSDFSDEPDAVIDYDADFEQSAPDITTENLIAPAFYEAWNDFYSGTYLDIKTGERKKLREQWFSGGRGCVDGDTLIDTPNGKVKIRDFKGGEVYAFDGEKIVVTLACRPISYTEEDLFEVRLSDGRKIVTTDQHRFLTRSGWLETRQLSCGDDVLCPSSFPRKRRSPNAPSPFAKSSLAPLSTRCAESPSKWREDVRRSTRTLLNCVYRYWHDCRLCDGLPPREGETYRDVFRQLTDVLERTRACSHTGGSGRGGRCSRCGQRGFHPSTPGCPRPSVGKCSRAEESQIARMLSESLSVIFPSVRLSRRSGDLDGNMLKVARLVLASTESSGSSEVCPCESTSRTGIWNRQSETLRVLADMLRLDVADVSFSNAFPFGWNEDNTTRDPHYTKWIGVVSIRKVKRGVYWDMFVPIYNNYVANGIVNHNSTKSSFCAAAITLGLEDDWNKALDHKYGRNGCGIGPHKDRPDPHWYRYITNAIVYRKVGNTLADSVFNQFLQTMGDYMGPTITDHWEFKHSPLRIVNTLTGQVIMFRGLDDPLKSKSIKPPKGYFKYLWFEELAEYKGAEEIRNVRQSIVRGGHEFKVLCSYNPPETASEWVNDAADKYVEGRKVYKSDYTSVPVEWLGEDFFILADQLKKQNYRAWRHEYMGDVTGNGGTIFENLVKRTITDEEISHFDNLRYGLDFGYSLDPSAAVFCHLDKTRRILYIFDEVYQKFLLNAKLAELVKSKIRSHDWVMCDSADPKSIDELHSMGVNTLGAVKGPMSREFGIKWLQSLRFIVIDPDRCPNTYREFKKYEFEKDKSGEFISKYPEHDDHTVDGVRYACENDMTHGGLF